MPEEPDQSSTTAAARGRGKDEVALELMKFIAITTGYGKAASAPGFSSKPAKSAVDEYTDALLQLFERCRAVVGKIEPEK
jgi:hypothetical protein